WGRRLELVRAHGPSRRATDGRAAGRAAREPRGRTAPNPSGRTPDGLNAAIDAASGEVIARVDAHAEIPTDYLSCAVATLEETGADNVGGIMDAVGASDLERAIACAMKSPLGVGGARFHTGGGA